MKFKVTLNNGEVHFFESPFTTEALRKFMNLPSSAIIEPVLPEPPGVTEEEDAAG